jgi:hypothetical protein
MVAIAQNFYILFRILISMSRPFGCVIVNPRSNLLGLEKQSSQSHSHGRVTQNPRRDATLPVTFHIPPTPYSYRPPPKDCSIITEYSYFVLVLPAFVSDLFLLAQSVIALNFSLFIHHPYGYHYEAHTLCSSSSYHFDLFLHSFKLSVLRAQYHSAAAAKGSGHRIPIFSVENLRHYTSTRRNQRTELRHGNS